MFFSNVWTLIQGQGEVLKDCWALNTAVLLSIAKTVALNAVMKLAAVKKLLNLPLTQPAPGSNPSVLAAKPVTFAQNPQPKHQQRGRKQNKARSL